MFLTVVVSVAASAMIFAALLFVTRQRLSRQFENIQRRLVVTERTFSAIKLAALKLEIERGTTAEQLQRLHLGLVRVQENAACRHDALISEKKRSLTGLQLAALQQWAAVLEVPLKPEQIEKLANAVEWLEALALDDVPIETPDLLAGIIALLGKPERKVSIALAGASAGSLATLLARMAPGFFEEVKVVQIPARGEDIAGTEFFDALVLDAAASESDPPLARVKDQGVLVLQGGAARDFPGFELVAGEWNTRVYRKCGVR